MANRYFMPRPILLYNRAVIHGNFCGTILEIGGGIAPSRHHGPKQLIRFHESASWIVHELGLYRAPQLLEPIAIRHGERAQRILTDALFNLLELRLGFEFIASFGDGPVVFRPETRAELLGAILQDEHSSHCDYSNHDNHEQ